MPLVFPPGRLISTIAYSLTCLWFASMASFVGAQQLPRSSTSIEQSSTDVAKTPVGVDPSRNKNPEPDSVDSPHRFLDRTNILLFSGLAISRALDYTSTRNMLARGREERLIPDDVVQNTAGFASLEAAGAATSIGISYLLHRTGHHKLERWMSIGHISVTGFGAVRNYSLESKHR
jgi:hypothetical protein